MPLYKMSGKLIVNMAYTSLYRKYRPQTFSSMIGQQHVRQTLKNSILSGNIAHAYLFTGSRGTGKTSTAKIFAKAINCLHPLEDGSPCGKCEVCKALSMANNMDILELDAASNNSVENIRKITEGVAYAASAGRYKVYIIDEVHMLSPAAFNAFLKTLEEPPEHVVFILATTDVQKIPATILSRCMRFDFRLIPNEELVSHLEYIFKKESIPYDIEAVKAIAEAGNGSVRDMLSIAEMVVSFCGTNRVDYESVVEVLGASSPSKIYEICDNIVLGKVDMALSLTNNLINNGKSINIIADELAAMMNNILYTKNCQDAVKILSLPTELFMKIKETAASANNSKLYRAAEIFASLQNQLRYSSVPKIVLETAVAKACDVSSSIDDLAILKRVADLEAFKRTFEGVNTQSGTTITAKKVWGDLLVVLTQDKVNIHYERPICEKVQADPTTKVEIVNKEIWISTKNQEILDEVTKYKTIILRTIQSKYPEIQNLKVVVDVSELDQSMQALQSLFDSNKK